MGLREIVLKTRKPDVGLFFSVLSLAAWKIKYTLVKCVPRATVSYMLSAGKLKLEAQGELILKANILQFTKCTIRFCCFIFKERNLGLRLTDTLLISDLVNRVKNSNRKTGQVSLLIGYMTRRT